MFGHPGGRTLLRGAAALFSMAAMVCTTRAATSEQIQKAIDKGQEYLLSKQNRDGTWELVPRPELGTDKDQRATDLKARQWGGLTAIATYALLASGMSPQDAKIKGTLEFLEKANIQSTYGLGLSAQVWLLVPQTPQVRAVMIHDASLLELGMIKKGEHAGLYGYWTGAKKGSDNSRWTENTLGFGHEPEWAHDLSNSQYAVLGMWALDQGGVEVPVEYWKKVETAWKKAQLDTGGWRYTEDRPESASMTAAGIATLFITQDYTLGDSWGVCKGGVPSANIEKGLAWMDQQIDHVIDECNFYTMYGIERIGVASGRKYFGATDWYAKGADTIVHRQASDGSWGGDIPNTCFALLFLARGGAPVMMNKLQYELPAEKKESAGVWNERPRDLANLARWSGRQLERDLNWQTVTLKVAPEELHDAPILYIAGNQELQFSADDVAKLRTFVQQGGLVLGNADCAQAAFARSFQKLGAQLLGKYEFRELAPAHPIFTREQFAASRWRTHPKVMGLSNGVRELMLLIGNADAARAWQGRSDRTKQELFQLGADIFLYSVDKRDLREKGQSYLVDVDANVPATARLKLARLMAGGNPDPEPYGWKRLAAILHNQQHIDLNVFNATPGDGTLVAARVAHLTGTTAFELKPSARADIKSFVDNGGTLIVEAAGGSAEFAASAENELRAIFGAAAGQLQSPLPPSSPVYTQTAVRIDKAGYRQYAREALLGSAKTPMLRGIRFGDRIRVFFSREDLSAGLVGQPVDGIYGYSPQSATDLMTAMLLYAAAR